MLDLVVRDIIEKMDVVEKVTFPCEKARDDFHQELMGYKDSRSLIPPIGPVEATHIDHLVIQIKGKILDVAPVYIVAVHVSTLHTAPSRVRVEVAKAKAYLKEQYGYTSKVVGGELVPTITLTEEVVDGLMEAYPELLEKVRAAADHLVDGMKRKYINQGVLKPFVGVSGGSKDAGLESNFILPTDTPLKRPVWDPDKQISEGFVFTDGILEDAWGTLTRSPVCVTRVGADTVVITGRAKDVCETIMKCMELTLALWINLDNVGNYLSEKYGYAYTSNLSSNTTPVNKTVTFFTPSVQPQRYGWTDGFIDNEPPEEVDTAYNRVIEIYDALRSANTPLTTRVALMTELNLLSNPDILLYSLKRHHDDVE